MHNLTTLINRLAALAIDVVQSVVAGFGGGNGDPTVLNETVDSSHGSQPNQTQKLKRKRK